MEDAEVQQMLASINRRMAATEAQSQHLTQILNNTQVEFITHSCASTRIPTANSGIPKGMKTTAPNRFSGRPTVDYPTTKHFIDFATRYMRVVYQRWYFPLGNSTFP